MASLANLLDAEVLQHFENTRDPLTSTEVEIELAKRLAALLEEQADNEPLLTAMNDQGIYDAADVKKLKADLALLAELKAVLDEHELPEDAEALGKELEALATAREAITEADEAFTKARDALAVPA
jgi:hypothetical protein